MLAGIEELETVLAESPSDYAIATVVTHAHMDMDMDMGWSWRGSRFDIDVSETNQNAFCAHFDRAADILAPISELKPKHVFLAAARMRTTFGPSRWKRKDRRCLCHFDRP